MYSSGEAYERTLNNKRRIREGFFAENETKFLKLRSVVNKSVREAIELGLFAASLWNTDLMKPFDKKPRAVSEETVLKHLTQYLTEAGYTVEITHGSTTINWAKKSGQANQDPETQGRTQTVHPKANYPTYPSR